MLRETNAPRRLVTAGAKWRAHRKLIAPTFHLNVLKSFIDLFNANSRAVVEKMQKEQNKEFDVHDYMSELTVEILLETAMGVSKNTQGSNGFEYAMAVMKYVYTRVCFFYPLTQTFSSSGESRCPLIVYNCVLYDGRCVPNVA